MYVKMMNNSSAKDYQKNKERLQKRLVKDIKIFFKKAKKKRGNMVANDIKTIPNMKNKG